MISRVLVIGGYGNFGSFITKALAQEANIQVIVAGRFQEKAQQLVTELAAVNSPEAVALDIRDGIANKLSAIQPNIVIHTSGPFQTQGYDVAKACIAQGCHYIDLADGREFVEDITELDNQAKVQDVLVISGASSVPCLTSALLDYYQPQFGVLEEVSYGIATAQKTARGLATTAAILGYTGRPFQTLIKGKHTDIYGWQGLHRRKFKNLGWRLLGNCDVPDLALFPERYPDLKTIRFYAGLEIPFIHITLWLLSWLVRIGLLKNLQSWAPLLLRLSSLCDWFGSANSGFYMELSGKDLSGGDNKITFELTARSGDGPYIPCMPSILIAKKLAGGTLNEVGAYPCLDFISRDEYLNSLSEMDICWEEFS